MKYIIVGKIKNEFDKIELIFEQTAAEITVPDCQGALYFVLKFSKCSYGKLDMYQE